jgi:Uma2 family endonuclease
MKMSDVEPLFRQTVSTMKSGILVSKFGDPTWEITSLFPPQGEWTEDAYLSLRTNHLVELADGFLEVLPMPTTSHQLIVAYLWETLKAFVEAGNLGTALFAPLRIRLWPGQFREPDVVFMLAKHASRVHEEFWEGADLVMEVVSRGKPEHDRDTKRAEYARARIPEYWIVDVLRESIEVLILGKRRYKTFGSFGPGGTAQSHLLPGFELSVDRVLAGGKRPS